MKKFRKIMAVLVAAVLMISSFTLTAFAATDEDGRIASQTGTITISNAQDGETYNAYEIFALLSFDDDNNVTDQHSSDLYSYGISTSSKWLDFFDSTKQGSETVWGSDYIEVDKTRPITIMNATGTSVYGTYFPVKMKTGGSFLNNGSPIADEDTRDEAIAGLASGVQKFAAAAKKFATTKSIPASYTVTATSNSSNGSGTTESGASATGDGNKFVSVSFEEVELGYYLIDSTIGTLCALDTTNLTANVIEKNDIPTIEKLVLGKGHGTVTRDTTSKAYSSTQKGYFVENTDYSIGTEVQFLTTISVPKYAKNYKLHDVMEEGFTLTPASVKVYYTAQAGAAEGVLMVEASSSTDYTLTTGTIADKCDFEIEFKQELLDKLLKENSKIEIDYTAKLNGSAVIYGETRAADSEETNITVIEGDPAVIQAIGQKHSKDNGDGTNDNWSVLSYGVKSSTAWANASVDTYGFDVVKYVEDKSLLAGASFRVYENNATNIDTDANGIPQVKSTAIPLKFSTAPNTLTAATNYSGTGDMYYLDATSGTAEKTTTANNKILFRGLAAGTYYVEESYAPSGYDAIPGLIKVVIDDGSTTPADEGKITITMPRTTGNTEDVTRVWEGAIDNNGKYTEVGGIPVLNKTSKELPSTGGMGTTVLYIVGGMLVILAGAYLFFSRKRTA